MAGRVSGYFQAALGLGGLLATIAFAGRFVIWYFGEWQHLQEAETDPVQALTALWAAAKWPLLGFSIFAAGWLWALMTSWAILRAARRSSPGENAPPVLK